MNIDRSLNSLRKTIEQRSSLNKTVEPYAGAPTHMSSAKSIYHVGADGNLYQGTP